jgi:hypothetical protein
VFAQLSRSFHCTLQLYLSGLLIWAVQKVPAYVVQLIQLYGWPSLIWGFTYLKFVLSGSCTYTGHFLVCAFYILACKLFSAFLA